MRLSPVAPAVAAAAVLATLTSLPEPAKAGIKPEVDVYDTTVNETVLAPVAMLTVRMPEKARTRVTVRFRTVDGTAKAGTDYVAKSGKVVLEPGQRAKTITIPVGDDDRVEPTEYFYVAFASRQARVTTKRATVSVIDDDVAPYTGDMVMAARTELEAEGFYTLETWELTFQPSLVPMYHGSQWYDDGFGDWQLTGTRILEDHRPGAPCRVLEKEEWSGQGVFFTEPHTDSDITGRTGNLVLENFFPQYGDNLGYEPLLHVTVQGHADGTQYSFEDGDCVPSSYQHDVRVGSEEEVSGTVVTSGGGRIVRFDHHVLEDNTTTDGLDTFETGLQGDLVVKVE